MTDIAFHVGGRRTGKTTKIVEWLIEGEATETKRVIVSFSEREAERLFTLAQDLCDTVEDWQFITFGASSDLCGKNVVIGIDNLEFLLGSIFGSPVEFVTVGKAEDGNGYHQYGITIIDIARS